MQCEWAGLALIGTFSVVSRPRINAVVVVAVGVDGVVVGDGVKWARGVDIESASQPIALDVGVGILQAVGRHPNRRIATH